MRASEAVPRHQRSPGRQRVGGWRFARNLPRASANGWVLISTPYALEEALRNLPDLPPPASAEWARLRPALLVMDDVLTLNRPAVFHAAKDRPILFSALAWADVLLTLDRGDFGSLMCWQRRKRRKKRRDGK